MEARQAGRQPLRVLVVEDDEQMASLLELVVQMAAPGAEVERCADVRDAEERFSPSRHGLVICDWNLPGRPGIALLRTVRAVEPRVPVLMVTGRTDRASVITARAQGVDEFIAKPFKPEQLVERLRRYLPAAATDPAAGQPAEADAADLAAWLEALDDAALEAPLAARVGGLVTQAIEDEPPDLEVLAETWSQQPALCGRLLALANSSAFNPHGRLCGSLLEALQRLGWRTSLNVACLLALRQGTKLEDERLSRRLEAELDLCERVAERVGELAREAGVDPAPLEGAALMHRLGELCTLLHIALWEEQTGRRAEDAQIDAAVRRFSRDFAHRLKTVWRYPQPLRALIAAIYALAPGTSRRELLLLRLAGGSVHGDLDAEQEARLRRLVFD